MGQRRIVVYRHMRDKRERAARPLQQALRKAMTTLSEHEAVYQQALGARDAARAELVECEAQILLLKNETRFAVDRMVMLLRYRDGCIERQEMVDQDVSKIERVLALAREHCERTRCARARNQAKLDAYAARIAMLQRLAQSHQEREQEEQAEEIRRPAPAGLRMQMAAPQRR